MGGRRALTAAAVFVLALAARTSAQTAAPPEAPVNPAEGLLARGVFLVALAPIRASDPRFSVAERARADLDLVDYGVGRANLLLDTELVMGSERRAFDLNQANVMFEMSGSYRRGALEVSAVAHHVSRHVVDREFDHVVAWNTVGVRVGRLFRGREGTVDVAAEYGWVVQHTFVDYTSTSQVTARLDRPIRRGVHLLASGRAGAIGTDGTAAGRGRQVGARGEAGVRLPGRRAALDLFAVVERRVDGYPGGREPVSWFEAGFRIGVR